MDRSWNKTQQAAIDHRNGNILVSAGAGSGKTSVLTERVARLVEEGVPLPSILVLTFTNAAAKEMKDRIRERLAAAKHPAAHLVDAARIMTFDAFALALVRQYHDELGLGDKIGVLDDHFAKLLRRRTIDAVFADKYAEGTPAFVAFVTTFAVRKDDEMRELIVKADAMADLKVNKEFYYREYLAEHFKEGFIKQSMDDFAIMVRDYVGNLRIQGQRFINQDLALRYDAALLPLTEPLPFDVMIDCLKSFVFPAKPDKKLTDEDKGLYDALKAGTDKFASWSTVGSIEQVESRYRQTAAHVATVIAILQELEKRLQTYKRQVQQFTFKDIAKLAICLVEKPELRASLREEITHILVDEYQDTDDLQEYFIELLQKDNVFSVGDIKQSIYRFRNANCEIFNRKYALYAAGTGGLKLDMNENYRSRAGVIAGINRIFGRLMSVPLGGVDYFPDHGIVYGNKEYEKSAGTRHLEDPFIVHLLDGEDELDADEREIRLIAADIIAKMGAGIQVLDKYGYRPLAYGDFAILIDRRNAFTQYQKAFHEYGIPLDAMATEAFGESDILNVFRNLMRLLAAVTEDDYPTTYRHELMSVWRSFLYEYDDGTIYEKLRHLETAGDDPLFKTLGELKKRVPHQTLAATLADIALTFEFHVKAARIGDVLFHTGKIEKLIAWSASLAPHGFTLGQLNDYLEEAAAYDVPLTLEADVPTGPAVRLMTIHKAKGLEFPIVYYPGWHKRFNHPESKSSFLVHDRYGIVLPNIDDGDAYGLFHYLIKHQEEQAALSEEMRKLYVALTRTREQAVLFYRPRTGKPLISPRHAKSFEDLAAFIDLAEMFAKPKAPETVPEVPAAPTSPQLPLTFKQIEVPARRIASSRASETAVIATPEALAFGTKVHLYLSFLDFKTKDLGFIPEPAIRAAMATLLDLDIFKDAGNARVYHERHFYDADTGIHGIIDLWIEDEKTVRLYDLKTGSLDHEEYRRQLRLYGDYVRRLTSNEVRMYLVSYGQWEVAEVCFKEGESDV